MAVYSQGVSPEFTLSACGDANTWIYHFVRLAGGDDNFTIATGASNPAAIGVLQDNPRTGQPGLIGAGGRMQVYADATNTAIGVGDWLTAGSDGQAKVGAGSAVYGQSLKAVSSGASVLIDFIWQPSITVADNTP